MKVQYNPHDYRNAQEEIHLDNNDVEDDDDDDDDDSDLGIVLKLFSDMGAACL